MVSDGMGNLRTSVPGPYLIPITARVILLDESTSQLLNGSDNGFYNSTFVCLCRRITISLQVVLYYFLETLVSRGIPTPLTTATAYIQRRWVVHLKTEMVGLKDHVGCSTCLPFR